MQSNNNNNNNILPTRRAELVLQQDDVDVSMVEGREKSFIYLGTLYVLSVECTREELIMAKIGVDSSEAVRSIIFVLIGDIKVPLTKSAVVLSLNEREYTFALPNMFLQFCFPCYVDPQVISTFENLIEMHAHLRRQRRQQQTIIEEEYNIYEEDTSNNTNIYNNYEEQRQRWDIETVSRSVATSVVTSSEYLSEQIVKGSASINDAISSTSEYIKTKLGDNQSSVQVPPILRTTVKATRACAKVGVKVSGGLVQCVLRISAVLASTVSNPVTQSVVKRMVTSPVSGGDAPSSAPSTTRQLFSAAKTIVGASIHGVSTVLDSLDTASRSIMRTGADSAAQVVENRFGDQMGEVTREAFGVATDVGETYLNIRKASIRAIPLAAAKTIAASSIKSKKVAETTSTTTDETATTTVIETQEPGQQQQEQLAGSEI